MTDHPNLTENIMCINLTLMYIYSGALAER